MNTHLIIAIREHAERESVVKVLGITRVNGDSQHITEVTATFYLRKLNLLGDSLSLLLNIFRELQRIIIFSKNRLHLHIILPRIAQHPHDLAKRIARILRPVGHLHNNLLPIFCALELPLWNKEIDRHRLPLGYDKSETISDAEQAHKLSTRTLQNLNNLTLALPRLTSREHSHLHLVAMQRLPRVVSGNKNIVTIIIRNDIRLPRALHIYSTNNILRLRAILCYKLRTDNITERVILNQLTILTQLQQHLTYHIFTRIVPHTNNLRQLLIIQRLKRMFTKNPQYSVHECAKTCVLRFLFRHIFNYI